MEFKVEILPVLKSLEVDLRYEKVGKNHGDDLENTVYHYTD